MNDPNRNTTKTWQEKVIDEAAERLRVITEMERALPADGAPAAVLAEVLDALGVTPSQRERAHKAIMSRLTASRHHEEDEYEKVVLERIRNAANQQREEHKKELERHNESAALQAYRHEELKALFREATATREEYNESMLESFSEATDRRDEYHEAMVEGFREATDRREGYHESMVDMRNVISNPAAPNTPDTTGWTTYHKWAVISNAYPGGHLRAGVAIDLGRDGILMHTISDSAELAKERHVGWDWNAWRLSRIEIRVPPYKSGVDGAPP